MHLLLLDKWIILDEADESFLFVRGQYNFEEANSFCTEKGGNLYEPRDSSSYLTIRLYAKTKGIDEFWLGIHDKNEEGTFVYASDGKNHRIINDFINDFEIINEFKIWADGEPNNYFNHDHGSDEDCVILVTKKGKWNDVECKHHKSSIVCARDKPGTIPCIID